MTGLVPRDDFKRLQNRMNRLLEEFGISDPEARYMPEIRKIQERMNQLIDDFAVEAPMAAGDVMKPLADVKETDDEVVVAVDLPGMDKGDVEISVAEDLLEIKAERKVEKEEKGEEFYRKERSFSRYERSLTLPAGVKAEEARASLQDGVLTVHLPKVEVTTRKKVKIE
ncbi:Hsp20/alpha crystallin family protein [Methanothrix harundinacea]|uniref:Heat shock protein Hsp20 n=1 Tax=Methanothrix harundinacea (strain 6Ac) TaxID=1110509 RepID=G7WJY7_METH6|nr:Hsp20 family protein [Methanothrix harundinacea]AET63428.1 Heat shock protein Hsp20 [Methanothrix harundinacea 6Ac]